MASVLCQDLDVLAHVIMIMISLVDWPKHNAACKILRLLLLLLVQILVTSQQYMKAHTSIECHCIRKALLLSCSYFSFFLTLFRCLVLEMSVAPVTNAQAYAFSVSL